jgi:hypothetical protein
MEVKRPIRKISIVICLCVLFMFFIFIDSLRYPHIARSAYWLSPVLLTKATITCLFPGKGVASKTIRADAKKITGKDSFNISLLYLPALPRNDKTIQARVFTLIAKTYIETNESLFWVVTPINNRNIDDTLIYEYKTGRLVCRDI